MKRLMKKKIKKSQVFMLFTFLLLVSSCKNDDVVPICLDPSLFKDGKELTADQFVCNGHDYASEGVVKFKFIYYYPQDSTYYVSVKGVIPNYGYASTCSDYLYAKIKVTPMSNGLIFSPAEKELKLHGEYHLNENGSYSLIAKAQYEDMYFKNKSYTINFKKDFCKIDQGFQSDDIVDIEGQTYRLASLVNDFYFQMGHVFAQSDSCLQLSFNPNRTVDILLLNNKNGQTRRDSLMTLKYWGETFYTVEFTEKQALQFLKKWVSSRSVYSNDFEAINYLFTRCGNTDRYVMMFNMTTAWDDNSGIEFRPLPKYRNHFAYLFLNSSNVWSLPETEQEKMKKAYFLGIADEDKLDYFWWYWTSEHNK